MHAYAHAITAVSDPKPLGGSVAAAMATPEFKSISSVMASIGATDKIRSSGKISIAELESLMDRRPNLSIVDRIAIKNVTDRAGLLGA